MLTSILYSFRRCPYAVRARLAIASSGMRVELREILLRDKAPEFLAVSPSGTVPCLQLNGRVIDESLDIMKWALSQNDPDDWLKVTDPTSDALIAEADGPFKAALDRTKYASRYPDAEASEHRATATQFLNKLDTQLSGQTYLFRDTPTLADMAILPFVRHRERPACKTLVRGISCVGCI